MTMTQALESGKYIRVLEEHGKFANFKPSVNERSHSPQFNEETDFPLFFLNIPDGISVRQLKSEFSRCGVVTKCLIKRALNFDYNNKLSYGFV